MRIVYVVSLWNQSTETFVRREVAAALSAGNHVQVVSLRAPDAGDGIVDESSIVVHVPSLRQFVTGLVPAMARRPLPLIRSLGRILWLGRPRTWIPHLRAWAAAVSVHRSIADPDVMLAHFAWLSATTADVLAQLHGTPYVVFPHAHDIYETRCIDRYLSDRLQRAARVFVESERIAEDVRSAHDVKPVVMRMGVPDDLVLADVAQHRGGGAEIVSVGALRTKKGHDLLIGAVAKVDNVRLVIAGDGPERPTLERLVSELGIQDRVHLAGHLDQAEVCRLLDEAAVFCLASRVTATGDRDGVPNVLIEAMARAVPVVATEVSGIQDLLGEGRGLLVPPEDVTALRRALVQTLNDERSAVPRVHAALDHVRKNYTTLGNWTELENHLAQMITA